MALKPVARKGDKISHTNAALGQLIGAGVGVVVGTIAGAALAATGVGAAVAIPVAVGIVVATAGLGKWIGSMSSSETGEVVEGAERSFLGPVRRPIVRWKDGIECQDSIGANMGWPAAVGLAFVTGGLTLAAKMSASHAGAFVNDGVFFVFVEGKPISFIGAKTSCDGTISKGVDGEEETARTLVDGPVVGILKRSELKGDNAAVEWTLWALDWAVTLMGVGAIKKLGLPALGFGLKVTGAVLEKILGANHPLTVSVNIASGVVGIVDGIVNPDPTVVSSGVSRIKLAAGQGGILASDSAPKVNDAINGTEELPDVAGADAYRREAEQGLDRPWWISWSGQTTK